jgi:phosphatidylglycerophosphate synthase
MVNKLFDKYECPIDIHLYKFIDTHLHHYYNLGFTPNMVTTFSIIFGFFAAHQILNGNFEISAILMLIAYYLDCVDGKLARKYNMITKFGDLYDHLGDMLKYTVIICALFESNKRKTTNKQRVYMLIIFILILVQCLHFGYQESLYDKKHESPFLNICRQMVAFDNTPEITINYTRYFGCGTFTLCFALLIIFWSK